MAEPIVIKDWQTGIANSPHLGFADMRNVDIHSIPGVVQVGLRTVQATATLAKVKWFVTNYDDPTMVFGLDEGNRLLQSTDSGDTWAQVADIAGAGQGLGFWKKNVIVAGSNALTAFATPFTQGTALGTNIEQDGDYHPMLNGQDDILYGGSGRYVFSLQEVSGTTFTSNSVTTYTVNSQALDLPTEYRIKSLEELGEHIILGTFQGSANITNGLYSVKVADLFPWDRVSDSFRLPVKLNEVGVNQVKNINNVLYINAGIQGRYYVSNGSSTQPLFEIPPHIADPSSSAFYTNNPAAIAYFEGEVLFGTSGNTFGLGGQGVWSYKDGAKYLKNIISNAQDGSGTANVTIEAIHPVSRNDYLVSWSYGGVDYGIDKVSTSRYTGYQARVDSSYYPVGTQSKPQTFSELEFELVEPLLSGQGVRFSYRTDLVSSFTQTEPYTFDNSTYGEIQGGLAKLQVETKQGIQVRIEMTSPAGTANTPKLKTVTIR